MNQDQVKKMMLRLDADVPDFAVTFSGKKSFKVDGLYKPEDAEIIIHNKNFRSDNALVYTAIHEFAHHIQFTKAEGKVSCRAHTVMFWDIFHRLLCDAETKGLYQNVFRTNPDFIALTKRMKTEFLSVNGQLMKDFGALLVNAFKLCHENDVSFEDYADRELGLHRSEAKTIMKTFTLDINPEMGYENMKIAARVRDDDVRKQVEAAFFAGKSPDMVKAEFCSRAPAKNDEAEQLKSEKERIRKTMDRLKMRLAEIDEKLNSIDSDET
ncbi:MAG: hypothetical protein ACRCUT_10705 [Spirochaetota bacterium]